MHTRSTGCWASVPSARHPWYSSQFSSRVATTSRASWTRSPQPLSLLCLTSAAAALGRAQTCSTRLCKWTGICRARAPLKARIATTRLVPARVASRDAFLRCSFAVPSPRMCRVCPPLFYPTNPNQRALSDSPTFRSRSSGSPRTALARSLTPDSPSAWAMSERCYHVAGEECA